MSSPDLVSEGFVESTPASLRYNNGSGDPIEVFGRLRALMPSQRRVLDVGCGTGAGTATINQGKQNKVVCFEPDIERSTVARSYWGLDCRAHAFDEIHTREIGSFDVVSFVDVLEHMPNPAQSLRLARSILQPEGCVLISVPNAAHWSIRVALLLGRFDYTSDGMMDATHLRWFTFKTLRQMLEQTGFKVVEQTGTAGVWLPCYPKVRGRRYIIETLRRIFPALFSCQLIVKAIVA